MESLQRRMKLRAVGLITICFFCTKPIAFAQVGRGPNEFQLTRITKNLISTPQFTYSGAEQDQTNQRDRWLEEEEEKEGMIEPPGPPLK